MNITLVGFMGTGKTAVGKRLAKRLDWAFIDVDAQVEKSAGIPISQIFSEHGEPVFRRLEGRWVKRLVRGDRQVLSTGGGVFINEELRGLLRASGPVICLTAKPEVIYSRVKHRIQARPLLRCDDPLARIRSLLRERAGAYAKADVIIDGSDLTTEAIVEKIWALLEPTLCKGWRYLQEHGPQLAAKYGGQYVVVRDGRIVACGKTQLEAYQKASLHKVEAAAGAPGVRSSCETGIYYIPPSGKPASAA